MRSRRAENFFVARVNVPVFSDCLSSDSGLVARFHRLLIIVILHFLIRGLVIQILDRDGKDLLRVAHVGQAGNVRVLAAFS